MYFTPMPSGGDDYFNVNLKEPAPGKACDELYSVGGTTNWVAPNTWYWDMKAGKQYVVKVFPSKYDTGAFTLSVACDVPPEAACANETDDDKDGYLDCEDTDCFADETCTGGHSGEDCTDAFAVNGGAPITAEMAGTDGVSFVHHNTTAGRGKDLSAACEPASGGGPDTAYRFEVTDPLVLTASVEFHDLLLEPALYLFRGACTASGLEACGDNLFGVGYLVASLGPGTYFLVVDSGASGFDGIPDASGYSLELWFDPPAPPEDCENGSDEDGDGLVDCQDPGCFDAAACTGGHGGEDCADPFPLGGGQPLSPGSLATAWNTTVGRQDDLSGDCSPFSAEGPDAVHGFSLAAAATVTASVTFADGFTPALMVFRPPCAPADQVACAVAEWDTATITTALDAGEWRLVVDSGDAFMMLPAARDYTLSIVVSP